jgi:hypothetical protein
VPEALIPKELLAVPVAIEDVGLDLREGDGRRRRMEALVAFVGRLVEVIAEEFGQKHWAFFMGLAYRAHGAALPG